MITARSRNLAALVLAVALAVASVGCADKLFHFAVVGDSAVGKALHEARVEESNVYHAGAYDMARHDANLKVLIRADRDAIALTDAIDAWHKAGADPATLPALAADTRAALQKILDDLKLAPNNPFVQKLQAVIKLLG